MKKASLVAAYGDKHALFTLAIKKYLTQGKALLRETLSETQSSAQAIGDWLRLVGGMCVGSAGSRGCLAVNTMIEMSGTDSEAAQLLRNYKREIERMLANTIAEGIERGEFQSGLVPETAARFLTACTYGLFVGGKNRMTKSDVNGVVELTLSALT